MDPKSDIHNYNRRYENAKIAVEVADITKKNREWILKFEKVCNLENLSLPRRIRIIGGLIAFAKSLNKDFDKASKGDLKDAVLRIENNKNWSHSTKHTYKAIIRKFYKWLVYGDEYKLRPGYPELIGWFRLDGRASKQPKVMAADIITEREIERIIQAAEHPRDKAFISMLYELGARISEIGMLRIRDITRDKHSFIVDLSGKTGHRTPRIVISDPHLSTWLNTHPRKDNPSAPLWVMLGDRNKNERMNYGAFRALVLRLTKKAKIQKRIYPHLFRHTRVTHLLSNKQINESQAKVYFGWSPSSKMLSEYSHLVSQDVNRVMLEIHGISPTEKKQEDKIKPCPRCKKINPSDHLFCMECGGVLEVSTAMDLDDKRKGFDDIASPLLMDADVQEAILKAMLKKGLGKKLMDLWNR